MTFVSDTIEIRRTGTVGSYLPLPAVSQILHGVFQLEESGASGELVHGNSICSGKF